MSYARAVAEVLEHHSGGASMHYRDIAHKAYTLGLIPTHGRTGETSVNVTLNKHPIFCPVGGGYYALAKWHGGHTQGVSSMQSDDDDGAIVVPHIVLWFTTRRRPVGRGARAGIHDVTAQAQRQHAAMRLKPVVDAQDDRLQGWLGVGHGVCEWSNAPQKHCSFNEWRRPMAHITSHKAIRPDLKHCICATNEQYMPKNRQLVLMQSSRQIGNGQHDAIGRVVRVHGVHL